MRNTEREIDEAVNLRQLCIPWQQPIAQIGVIGIEVFSQPIQKCLVFSHCRHVAVWQRLHLPELGIKDGRDFHDLRIQHQQIVRQRLVALANCDEMRRQGFPRSREIVDAVEGYLAQNATLSITNHLPQYRSRVRQLIPLDAQEFYWDNCYFLTDGAETYVLDCPKGISDEAAARAVGAIADAPDIGLLLTEWAGLHTATPDDLDDQNEAANRALQVIEKELERRQ
ncbi:MAG: hypothetical protein RLN72_09690 [Henriciella sp.]